MKLEKLSTPSRMLLLAVIAFCIAAVCGLIGVGIGTFIDTLGSTGVLRHKSALLWALSGTAFGLALGITVIQYMGQSSVRD
jgi:hypothetical protein